MTTVTSGMGVGPTGPAGTTGPAEATGAQGVAGAVGAAGATGATGAAGTTERRVQTTLGQILAAGSLDVPVTWATAMPSTAYTVLAVAVVDATSLGKVFVGEKPGTRTTAGVTITAVNLGVGTLLTGVELHVLAVMPS